MAILPYRLHSKDKFDNIKSLNKKPSAITEGSTDSVKPDLEAMDTSKISGLPNLRKQRGKPMSKKISIEDSSAHIYFSTIPNIIFELDWSPYKISSYCVLKRVAGESGICTKSYEKLAKQAGMKRRNFIKIIKEFCEPDKILKKPLIKICKRFSEYGDRDTNIIKIVDIWPENINYFGGSACGAPPSAYGAPGVVHMVHQGGAYGAHKEEPIKNNNLRTTATSCPSNEKIAAAAVYKENKNTDREKEIIAEKEAAISLKNWLDKESCKNRTRKTGTYREEIVWGEQWIIPIDVFEKLIQKYGITYFQDQLRNMTSAQKSFDEGKSKRAVDNPERFLYKACRENYAESNKNKMEKK